MFLQDLDYIVIGSGMGGLWLAAALTKCGYKVMVLEQLLRREVLLTKFSITPNRFGCFGFFGSPHKILTQNLTTFHGCFNIFKRLDIFRLDYIRYQPWTLPIVSLGFQGITSQEAVAMPLIRMVWSLRQACSSVRRLDIWFVFMRWENGRYHLQSAILRRFQGFLSGSFQGWRLIFFHCTSLKHVSKIHKIPCIAVTTFMLPSNAEEFHQSFLMAVRHWPGIHYIGDIDMAKGLLGAVGDPEYQARVENPTMLTSSLTNVVEKFWVDFFWDSKNLVQNHTTCQLYLIIAYSVSCPVTTVPKVML